MDANRRDSRKDLVLRVVLPHTSDVDVYVLVLCGINAEEISHLRGEGVFFVCLLPCLGHDGMEVERCVSTGNVPHLQGLELLLDFCDDILEGCLLAVALDFPTVP